MTSEPLTPGERAARYALQGLRLDMWRGLYSRVVNWPPVMRRVDVIGVTELGVWFNDERGSTHLMQEKDT